MLCLKVAEAGSVYPKGSSAKLAAADEPTACADELHGTFGQVAMPYQQR